MSFSTEFLGVLSRLSVRALLTVPLLFAIIFIQFHPAHSATEEIGAVNDSALTIVEDKTEPETGRETSEITLKSKPDVSDEKKVKAKQPATSEISVIKKFYTASLTAEKKAEFKKIIAQYRRDRKKAGPSYSLFVIGLIRELSGEYDAAIGLYQKLIGLYPKSKHANLSKERISECYLAMGDSEKAIANYLEYFKWRVSEGKREEILYRVARVYNQTLTTFEGLMEAYMAAAARFEYSQGKTIEYLVGYFKGFHILDAHMATFYYRQILKEYPDGLYKFDALLNMAIIFAYDLSDIDTAKKLLEKLFSEKSEYAKNYNATQRKGLFIYGLLSQFHSPASAGRNAPESYKKVIADTSEDALANMAAYYLGYYYEQDYSVTVTRATNEIVFNRKSLAADYLAEIKNDSRRPQADNAISAYMLGFLINKDEFFAEECAYRATLLLIDRYSDTVSAEFIYSRVKKEIKKVRRERDFEDLVNLKLPSVFGKSYSALFSKEKKLYESSQYKKAIETHEEIAARSGSGPEAEYSLYSIGRIYEEDIKDYEMAIESYKRFLDRFSRSGRADKVRYQIAKIYEINLLDLNEAVKNYRKILDEGTDQLWVFQAGMDLCALYSKPVFKKEAESVAILEKLRDRVPMREDEVLFKLAEAYEKAKKKDDPSAALYERIVKEYPGSIYFDQALDKLLTSVYKENLAEINQKIVLARVKKDSNLLPILNEKFEKEKFVGNYREALNTLTEIKKLSADSEEIFDADRQAAEIQIEGLNEVAKGIEALRKLAAQASGTESEPAIQYSLGKALEEREKDYNAAIQAYERVIKMDELHSKIQMNALFRAGIIYALNLKDYENAFRCYSLIMAKYPREASEEKLDAKIANLLNIDISILQKYLSPDVIKNKKRENPSEGETAEVKSSSKKTRTSSAAEKSGDDEPVISETLSVEIIQMASDTFETQLEYQYASAENAIADPDDYLIEEPSWFSKAGRPDYSASSWFKKGTVKPSDSDYSWFQKPVDLSDIGITEPSWFKRGGVAVIRKKPDADEETLKMKAELALPALRSSRTVKYLNYIENNPTSPKLPIILYYLGISYEDGGDFSSAADTYQKIISDYDQYPKTVFSAYERLAMIIAREYNDYERALFLVKKIKEKLPKFFGQADSLAEVVKVFKKIRQNDDYIRKNIGDEKCLELMYENSKLYEEKLKDFDNAVSYLNKCTSYISGETEEIKYKLDIVRICKEKKKDFKLAFEELNDILERFSGYDKENEVRFEAADILINRLNLKDRGIALLEKIRDTRRGGQNYRDAMILLQSAYADDKIVEKSEAVQSLREVVPELTLAPDIEKSLKKIEIDKKTKDLLDIISSDAKNPANSHYMYYIARLYEREAEDYESAAKYYRQLVEMDISEEALIQGITALGLIYETKLKKPEKSIALYREFVKKNKPQNTDFLAYLQFKVGECYELLRKKTECIDEYRRVKLYFPISRWAKTAEDRIAQIAASPERFVSLRELRLGEDEEEGTKEVAVKEKSALEIGFGTTEISLTSAEIEIAKEQDPEKKIEKLQALIDTLPEKDPKLPMHLIEVSKLYEKTQKPDKAAEALKRIIDNFPKYPRYYDVALKLAEMYRVDRNIDEALKYYKQIVQESPQYEKTEYVRYMLGKMYVERQEYIYAVDTFQELTDRYQDSLYAKLAQYEKGMVHERFLKDYDAAIRDFEVMVDRYFDHENAADAQMEIGWIYENAKRDLVKAKEAYQTVLDRFPNSPKRRQVIDSIERINAKLPK